ncbi:MAG: IS5 family transposase, partial [archaeon]|nr:IS5 family transposase [archaeon]
KFEKAKYKITNWPEYNNALKQRGNINIWFQSDIKDLWYYKKPKNANRGRQKIYSDKAVITCVTLGQVFNQRLRQTEGFVTSIVKLMDLSLDVPDFSTFSRRMVELEIPKLSKSINSNEIINIIIDSTGLKIYGQGEWHECKHGLKKRKNWCKLHLAIDEKEQKIIASELTTQDVGDLTQAPILLDEVNNRMESVFADGAYYSINFINHIEAKGAKAIIPPKNNGLLSENYRDFLTQRDQHILDIFLNGRLKWQKETGYNFRSLVETAMFRYQQIIGTKLKSRKFANQKIESKIGCIILNNMNDLGMPESFKVKEAA